MSTRREFLGYAASAFGAAALAPVFAYTQGRAQAVPGVAPGMIVRSQRFFDLETSPELLRTWITPVPAFFIRNHMAEPFAFDLGEWRLKITGEVEREVQLSYSELQRMPQATVVNTLECAGNGRSNYQPHVPGVQWQRGAVGNARFAGPRLRDVLARAGVKPSGKHIAMFGLDEPPSKVPKFVRSIPLEKATDADTLLATHMNEAPLTKHHGYPARALVPGWIGAASVKWLAELRVLPHEFEGNFMSPGYRLPNQPIAPGGDVDVKQTHPLTALGVKSIITSPAEGSRIRPAALEITGAAWAGEQEVTKVEVSTDEGKTWKPASLRPEHAKYAWRLFSFAWTPPAAGDYVLMSRATDSAGHVQPMQAAWNPSGYVWNGIDRVNIHVS